MSQPAEALCKVSFVDLVVPLLVRALVIQAKKKQIDQGKHRFIQWSGRLFVFFLGGKLGVKEENKNKIYRPENEHVTPKKGHFKIPTTIFQETC